MLEAFPSPAELTGAVQGTLLYLGLYICFIVFQSFSKFYLLSQKQQEAKAKGGARVSLRALKYYNSKDMLALTGDRTVGNYLEFSIVFLPCMWLHALFVDPSQSLLLCTMYAACRLPYPFIYLYGSHPLYILVSTIPCYLIKIYLVWMLVVRVVVN